MSIRRSHRLCLLFSLRHQYDQDESWRALGACHCAKHLGRQCHSVRTEHLKCASNLSLFISMLERKISVAPIMDWTDSLKILGRNKSLSRYKKARHLYGTSGWGISAWPKRDRTVIETVSGPSRRALQPGRGCASHCAPRGTFAKEAAATLLPMPQISGADMSFELRSTETQTRQKCRKPRRSLHTPVYEPL